MPDYSSVVVTGAAGWLGQSVVDALAGGLPEVADLRTAPFPGVRLLATDRLESKPPPGPAAFVKADLRDQAECKRIFADLPPGALVVHCAGLIHPRRVKELYEVNHTGMVNLLAAAAGAKAARLVAVSSNSPCGCNPGGDELFDEESAYNPYLSYGRSKMLMEQAVRAQNDIPWTIIRAPWFYGPRQPARQTLFFSMIKNGKGPVVGGGENRRSMAYIDNLTQAIIKSALHPAAVEQIYWIADSQPYTMNQIIDTIERLLEVEFSLPVRRGRLRLPGIAARVAYLVDSLLQAAGLYHSKVHVLSEMNKTIACSIEKAKREIGYVPTVDLEEGMRRSIKDALARNISI